jgi:hypothetical protein
LLKNKEKFMLSMTLCTILFFCLPNFELAFITYHYIKPQTFQLKFAITMKLLQTPLGFSIKVCRHSEDIETPLGFKKINVCKTMKILQVD